MLKTIFQNYWATSLNSRPKGDENKPGLQTFHRFPDVRLQFMQVRPILCKKILLVLLILIKMNINMIMNKKIKKFY